MAKGLQVNRTKLAELFGVALTTVDGWRRKGCPHVYEKSGKSSLVFNTADVATWLQNDAITSLIGNTENVTFDEAKIRKVKAEAALAELELQKKTGEVVDVETVYNAGRDSYISCRSRFMTIASRLSHKLANESKPLAIRRILEAEIHNALSELGNYDDDGDGSESPLAEGVDTAA